MVSGLKTDRLLASVIGHTKVIERFIEQAQAKRLASTYLFVGPRGVGKKTIAQALAQVLLCEKGLEARACGQCGSCLRGRRPPTEALLVIEPEKALIKIEQAEEILSFLNLRSLSPYRIIIIDQADCLNSQAANALLKVIEEPPPQTLFILTAPSPQHVLRTVLSRSRVVHFAPLSQDQLAQKSSAPKWALKSSQGSFERLQWLTQKEEQEIRESAVYWIQEWMQTPQGYLKPDLRDLMKDRSVALSLSRHLSWFFKDAAYWGMDLGNYLINEDKQQFIQQISSQASPLFWLDFSEAALQIERQLEANFDALLGFENLWIKMKSQYLADRQGSHAVD